MKYVTLAVPSALAQIANSICCAFEPDSAINPSTYDAFSTPCVGVEVQPNEFNPEPVQHSVAGAEYKAYGSEVKDWLADAVLAWKSDPEALHTAVQTTYADKWPSDSSPSLTACTQFCSAVLISRQYGIIAGLSELGLALTTTLTVD